MTAARAYGFDSRADLGLPAPRSISRRIDPDGVTWHYVGPAVHLSDHAACRRYWRQIHRMHTSPGGLGTTNGAADIAYTAGVCPHGIILAGRGERVRTGANGTDAGNTSSYAVCVLIGEGQALPHRALEALLAATLELRRHGGAGSRVWPHSAWRSTACPGNPIRTETARWDRKPISAATNSPTPPDEDDPMASISDDRIALLDALAGELLAADARGSSLAHVLNGWRAIAEAAGVSAADPAAVAERIVVTRTPETAALLAATARHLEAADARGSSLAHVLRTHRAIADELDAPANDPAGIAAAIGRLGA